MFLYIIDDIKKIDVDGKYIVAYSMNMTVRIYCIYLLYNIHDHNPY